APVLRDDGVQNMFPDGMVFRLSVETDVPIEKLRLRYEILPDGTRASAEPEFEPGESFTATFTLEGNAPPRIYLPPGTTIEYHWEATDSNGGESQTETATFFYDDIRFDWQRIDRDGVSIYYYSGSDEDAQAMLDVAAESISSMSALLGTAVDFPVKVWAYGSRDDMQPALVQRSESYEDQIITAGVRVASDTVLVLGNASFDTLRHELTHVVTAVAGESAFGELPAWVDEGTAVYGQTNPGGFESAIDSAIGRGNVLSVPSITSYPGDPNKVTLFYGESWSLVSYLIDTYGAEQYAALFAEVKSGKRIDPALVAVYGFDQGGLEDEWRAANGLPPRATPVPADDDQQPQETEPPDPPDASPSDDDSGSSTGSIIVIGVIVVLLLAVIGGGGLFVARRYR
ncbi:MAG: peptidase MA family metallohydrolase, partial [Dehalococcoidia bacterium]